MAGQGGEDRWAAGDLYELYVGRWSRLVARDFLGWLSPPSGLDWLEVGCGTGALTETIAGICVPNVLWGSTRPLGSSTSHASGLAQIALSSGRPMRKICHSLPPNSTASCLVWS